MKRMWMFLVLAAACGPSLNEVKTARQSSYAVDYKTVWQAVDDEMKARFDQLIEQEDAAKGVIIGGWKKVEMQKDNDPNRGGAGNSFGATLYRLKVGIVGGPPWRIIAEGEAARYTQNMSTLYPWKHGDPEEPEWLPGKVDAFYLGVHNRLKQYATTGAAPAAAPPAPAPAPAPGPAPAPDPAPAPAPAPANQP